MLSVVAKSGSHPHEAKRAPLEVGMGDVGEGAVMVSIVAESDKVVSESGPKEDDDPVSDPESDCDPDDESDPEDADGLLTGAVRETKDDDAPPVVRVTATSAVKDTVVVSADTTSPWLAVSVQTASAPINPQTTSPPKEERVGMSIVSDIPLAPSTSVTVR